MHCRLWSSYKPAFVCLFAGGRGWIWGGCSDNVDFGEDISKQFVDALENGHDARAAVNRHNNEAGRLVSRYNSLSLSFANIDNHSFLCISGRYDRIHVFLLTRSC